MFVKNSFFFLLISLWIWNSFFTKIAQQEIYGELIFSKTGIHEKIFMKEFTCLEEGENAQCILNNINASDFETLEVQDKIKIKHNDEVYFFRVIDKYQEEKNNKIPSKKLNGFSLVLVSSGEDTNALQTIIIATNIGNMTKTGEKCKFF